MNNLDNPKIYKKLDPENMLGNIQEFSSQIENCWIEMADFTLPTHYIKHKNILILGMGGSAIGGDLVRSLVQDKVPVPITVHRDYRLPGFVNSDTLIIASSYSGNTEETITAFEQACQKTPKTIVISTGGKLASLSRKYRCPFFKIRYGAQPRAALGYSFTAILKIFQKLKIIEITEDEIKEAILLLTAYNKKLTPELGTGENRAKQIAEKILGRIPIVLGSEILSEVAIRWKTQFNENSKTISFFERLPEANHNFIAGLEVPKDLKEKVIFLILQSHFDYPRNKLRQNLTLQILQQNHFSYESIMIEPAGTSLSEMLRVILLGDYVSYYLAILYRVDPTKIPNVEYLKERLETAFMP